MDLSQLLPLLLEGRSLSLEEAERAMEAIVAGRATPAQIGAFLTALRIKGETPEEIAGFARVLRRRAVPVRPQRRPLVDTCGTGGDGARTFNISTAAAFVVAGAGVGVAKHGNRAVSGRSGSADVLEALGVPLDLTPEEVARCIDEVGVGFLFAPRLHPALKHAAAPRRELRIRTVFNLLGPLVNPAAVEYQVLGVFAPEWTEPLARVLGELGTRRALVVHGAGGLDELSPAGPNRVSLLEEGEVRTFEIDPAELGIPRARVEALAGGRPEENALLLRRLLAGEEGGPRRDAVLLNAAAALWIAGAARDLEEGLERAARSLDSGAALERLEALIAFARARTAA